jgi:hypothetical protein
MDYAKKKKAEFSVGKMARSASLSSRGDDKVQNYKRKKIADKFILMKHRMKD